MWPEPELRAIIRAEPEPEMKNRSLHSTKNKYSSSGTGLPWGYRRVRTPPSGVRHPPPQRSQAPP